MKNVILVSAGILMVSLAFGQTLQDAQREIESENYFKARQILFKLLNDGTSDHYEIAYYLGDVYLKTDDADSAKLFYQKVTNPDTKYPLNYVAKGRLALLQKNTTEAKTNFDMALKYTKFKNANIYLEVGDAYLKPNVIDLKEAITALEAATALDPKSTAIMLELGDAYLASASGGDATGGGKAMTQYETATGTNKNLSIGYIKQGRLAVSGQMYDQAISTFNTALQIDQNYPVVHKELGEVYYYTKQYDKTLNEFKKYVDLSPGDSKARGAYLELLIRTKAYDKVVEEANKALKTDPNNPDFLRYVIYSDLELKRYAEGSDASNRFFALQNVKPKPRDITAAARLAAGSGDTTRAMNYFNQALSTDSNNCDLITEYAKVLFGAKHYADAANAYASKKAKCGDLKALDYYYMGRAYLLMDDSINADTTFAQFISKSPNTPDGYYWRARTNLKIGKIEDFNSLPYYQKYIELAEPTPAKYKDNLVEAYDYLGGYYLIKLKEKTKAKEYFNKALELDPNDENATEFLKAIK